MYLQNCIDTIKEYFPDNWEEHFNFGDAENANIELLSLISSATEKFFYNLNLSVLSGEYLDEPTFGGILSELEKNISNLQVDDSSSEDKYRDLFINNFFNGLINPINIAIKNYGGHFKRINRKYSDPDRQSIFEAVSNKNVSIPNNIPVSSVRPLLGDFINFNLELSHIDHNLAVRSNQLQSLILIYHSLESRTSKQENSILSLLYDKCAYLIKKVLTRYGKDPKNYYYALDFEDKSLDISKFDVGYFSEYNNSTLNLYAVEGDDNYSILKEYARKSQRNFEKAESIDSFEEYFGHIKYYKENSHNSMANMEHAIGCFKDNADKFESSDAFDKWSYKVSLNYFENNLLSYHIRNGSISLDNYNNFFLTVHSIQQDTEIKNYFPYLKLLQHLLVLCETSLKENPEEKYHRVQNVLNDALNIEKELYLCFEWCSDRNFIPFQPPKEECIKKVHINKDEVVIIFLSSSYVLPVNFQKVKKEIDEVSTSLRDLKSKLDIYKTIKEEKEQIKDIRASVEKSDRSHVEILGIFSAIVLFVSSDIQVFSKADTFKDALRFMLVFAYILVLFIMVIWLVTREKGLKWKSFNAIHIFLVILITAATIFSLYTIYF